jgi:hypothetical protein
MSSDDIQGRLEAVSICSYADLGEDEPLLPKLEQIRSVSLPQEFANRLISIDQDDPSNSEIYIGESGLEPPEESGNYILVDLHDESTFHIHLYFDHKTSEPAKIAYRNLSKIFGGVRISIIDVDLYADLEFDSLSLPVKQQENRNPNGVRYDEDSRSYLIQRIPSDQIENSESEGEGEAESERSVIYARTNEENIGTEIEDVDEYIEEYIGNIVGYLEGLNKNER